MPVDLDFNDMPKFFTNRPFQSCVEYSPDNTFMFETNNHSRALLSGLRNLRERELLFDVTLTVGEESFSAHRVVLASCSDYFRAMFTDGLKECHEEEITLNGITANGFRQLLDYAYSSTLAIDQDNVQDVLAAASHTQFWPVVRACCLYIQGELTIENCIDVAVLADAYSLTVLQDKVAQYICKNFGAFSMSPEFSRIPAKHLEVLLRGNYPVDCAEIDICLRVLDWVACDVEERMSIAGEILSKIQFDEIPFCDIEQVLDREVTKEVLAWNPTLQKLMFGKSRQSSTSEEYSGLVNKRGFQSSLVVVGGFIPDNGMSNDIMYHDNETDNWTILTTIPHIDQCNYGVVVHQNNLYVVGGCFNQNMQEITHPYGFVYCPSTDQWASIAPMLQERCRFHLGAVGDKLYAIGGEPGDALDIIDDISSCECYNSVTDKWAEISPMPGYRTQHAGATVAPYLYICGGLHDITDSVNDTMYAYDTTTDTWHEKSRMLSPRADHTMFVYKHKIYIMGGWFEDPDSLDRVIVQTIDSYDIETDQWEAVTHLPDPRLHASFTLFGDKLYVIGGMVGGDYDKKTKKVDIYNLMTSTWEESTMFPSEIWEHLSCNLYIPKSGFNIAESDC